MAVAEIQLKGDNDMRKQDEPVMVDNTHDWNLNTEIGLCCYAIDAVMLALWNRKEELIQRMFGTSTKDYQDEWRRRGPAEFWAQLDTGHRAMLVRIVLDWRKGGWS